MTGTHTVRRAMPMAALMATVLVAPTAAGAHTGSGPQSALEAAARGHGHGCAPTTTVLPLPSGYAGGFAEAVNGHGVVSGSTYEVNGGKFPLRATVWRNGHVRVIDVLTGWVPAGARFSASTAIDVNSRGTLAIDRWFRGPATNHADEAMLFKDGKRFPLQGLDRYSRYDIRALSASDRPVGWAGKDDHNWPVFWRGHQAVRVNVPRAATDGRRGSIDAVNASNQMAGHVIEHHQHLPWFWNPNGTGHALPTPAHQHHGDAIGIDAQGRIIGVLYSPTVTVVWPTPTSAPHVVGSDVYPVRSDENLDVIGSGGGNLIVRAKAGAMPRLLPAPSGGPQAYPTATDVARGTSMLAPDGGATAVGYVGARNPSPVVWTCAFHHQPR